MHANENGARAPIRRKKTHLSIGMKNKIQNYNDTEKIVGKERKKTIWNKKCVEDTGIRANLKQVCFHFYRLGTHACAAFDVFS